MVKCYLDLLPKDVARIVYRYLYDFVPLQIVNVVETSNFNPAPILRFLGTQRPMLESTTCKIHTSTRSLIDKNNNFTKWERSVTPCVCQNLIKFQDKSGMWNKHFDTSHRMSIINGVVYHLKKQLKLQNQTYISQDKYILVPFFESNYCWQDMAIRFVQFENYQYLDHKTQAKELKDCIAKFTTHDKILHSSNKESDCIIN